MEVYSPPTRWGSLILSKFLLHSLTPSLLLPLPSSCASSSPLTRISQQMPAQLTASSSESRPPYCELQLSRGSERMDPNPIAFSRSVWAHGPEHMPDSRRCTCVIKTISRRPLEVDKTVVIEDLIFSCLSCHGKAWWWRWTASRRRSSFCAPETPWVPAP